MRFPCEFCAALLMVLALAVAVLCEKDGGSLVLATVVPAQDNPRIGEAAQTKHAENGTAEAEPTATSRKDVVRAGQTISAEHSSRNDVSNEEAGNTPATSPNNAPTVAASERTALNSTNNNNSTSNGATVGTSTALPQQAFTADSTAQNADHKLATATYKSRDYPTPQPTVQSSSSNTATATTQHDIGVLAHVQEDGPSQDTDDAVVTGRSNSSTTQKTVTPTTQSTNSTAAPSSVRPETATVLVRVDEVASSLGASPTRYGPNSTVTAPPKLKKPPEKTKTTSSSVTPHQTAASKQVTPSPSREVAKNTSSSPPSGAAAAVAAMTNISEGEEVSITVIPEQEEQVSKNESTSSGHGKAATERFKETTIRTENVERLASASTTTTLRSQIFSYVNYTDEDDAAEIADEKSSTEKSNETEKATNLKTIDFHEYSTRETHQSLLSPLPAASQTLQPEVPSTLGERENSTLHSIPEFPVNLSGLNSSTSVVVSVSFAGDGNEAFVATKDNVSLPSIIPEPSQSLDLQNLVSNYNISSPKIGENFTSAKSSNGSGHISVFRPSSTQHRKYSPPTRRTTAAPSVTTPSVVAAKNHHPGRAGLHLPTRKTTPGAPGSATHKPHLGRSGTRAPFGNIGSTRRTTLGTKATIRPLTKIFDRARTRPHTKATTPRPNRGPRIRITTGKPTRKGFPIGPKPTLGNETSFDLDAYTRLLHITRRPSRPPEPTWRTTFFNLTDPTPAPNEVEAPVIRVAGIAKIVEGWDWSPLLGDHNTHEFRYLAYTMRRMLASIFRRTSEGRYLYRVDIDGFSPGSVIVDYFVLFYQRGGPVDPVELASAFNSQLGTNGSLGEEFFLDPTYTQFEVVGVVRPKPLASSSAEPPVPQWAIAVIVIATASLIFIVLFGAVTIYGRTAERRKYNSRLQDDDLENVTSSPSKEWESKLAASYENFAADSVYDTEDLHSPPPSHDPFQYDDRYKRKQHHMQLQLEYQQRQLKKEQEQQQKQQKQLYQQHWWQRQKQHQQPAQEHELQKQQKQWYQQHWWQRHKEHDRREAHEQQKQHKQLQHQQQQQQQQKQRHQQNWWQRVPSTLEKHWQQHQKEQKHQKQQKLQKQQQQQQQRLQQQHIDSERDQKLRRELEEKAAIEASLNAQDTWRNKWGVLVNKLPLHARDTAF
ncbi:uncharacterized protein LOC142582345 isoform X1 [Dermacentor variabilis]|uniref:uncharacterized protein LOC142582345 isoform X1 n=1 Tax=Dermacentor variabilis TaxID=34621 RepID=UPI003F5B4089